MGNLLRMLVVALGAAPLVLTACGGEDDVFCDGEDFRPEPADQANPCHDFATLYVRDMECIDGLFDGVGFEGLNSRNGELAHQYMRANYATSSEITECEGWIPEYEQRIMEPSCAAASTDCGPAPGGENACHTLYREKIEYEQRCHPTLYASEGMNSADAALASWLARADYAVDSDHSGVCGATATAYYADPNDQGICYSR